MDDLVPEDDADLLAYLGGQPLDDRTKYFLRAASEVVRSYCGWHIAPSVTATYTKLPVGSDGLIMVPSLYVTDVASVVTKSSVTLDAAGYDWFPQGFIELGGLRCTGWRTELVAVSMTHGYTTCPMLVKSIVFELMEQGAVEMPPNSVKSVHAPGYSLGFTAVSGLAMTPDQQTRLASYRIGGFK